MGAANWPNPSYDPTTRLFFVQVRDDDAQMFYKLEQEYGSGAEFKRGSTRGQPGVEHYGMIVASPIRFPVTR